MSTGEAALKVEISRSVGFPFIHAPTRQRGSRFLSQCYGKAVEKTQSFEPTLGAIARPCLTIYKKGLEEGT